MGGLRRERIPDRAERKSRDKPWNYWYSRAFRLVGDTGLEPVTFPIGAFAPLALRIAPARRDSSLSPRGGNFPFPHTPLKVTGGLDEMQAGSACLGAKEAWWAIQDSNL